ncbi:glycerol kinase GlpK [Porticoccaceae bacterium]|jgi:glycerol kinase|nr:glycerol kinase GlpK [Porticoccaceae bacterium]MDC0134001.1 glycerol kinase GlpK [Porticoccaceae bacterium]CAI8275041.1 MAG: Glycerol kinase [SAR92 bacterium MED-G29]|tara:strand:- start:2055 stop:3542 length:1488 start_codon:yes stop_codon:yes gene_type:complete
MTATYILAMDQGTTSSRAILFNQQYAIVEQAQMEFDQHFPDSGWVEHNPADIWQTSLDTAKQAVAQAGIKPDQIAAIGITNQRETTLLWDRATGEPIYNAIVWQDRRTADYCNNLKDQGHEAMVSAKTGLLLDPYFSATKIAWLLDNVEGARERAERGELAFGTMDSWLLWNLTEGQSHATDATNASRTMLYNIHQGHWDEELLTLFNIPASLLPDVKDCAADFGNTKLLGDSSVIPILGIAGDQQAATVGQACFETGMMKSTYGTGCFALLNTGTTAVASSNKLLTTIAYQLDGKVTYALEGSIFIAGAAVQWLRDGLGIIDSAKQSGELAQQADDNQDVYMIPAFTGLGAPWWDADARGALLGLTRGTGPAEIARAALESVCYQTLDLLNAMHADWDQSAETVLRVDGGMVASDWTMQRLADILQAPVDRPMIAETTALGAAWLAGSRAGVWPDQQGFADSWRLDKNFAPEMAVELRDKKVAGWNQAVQRVLS